MREKELAEKLKQLTDIIGELLFLCKKLKEINKKYLPKNPIFKNKYNNSEIPKFLTFLNVIIFDVVILDLTTILAKTKKDPSKKELSIFELIEMISDANKKEKIKEVAEKLRLQIEAINFDKWRNKITAHKDLIVLGDVDIHYLNFVNDETLNFCNDIISKLYEIINNNYNISFNNIFNELYRKSFNKMIELFENDLKKLSSDFKSLT